MSLDVESLGTMVANTGVFATLAGGEQPSALPADQTKLTIFSQNEDPLNPGVFIDTEIDLNADGVTFKLPTNDTTSQLYCQNSDGDQLLRLYAGPLGATVPVNFGTGAGVGVGVTNASVAVGILAGASGQGTNSVAVGNSAGQTNQGNNSVATGALAGNTNQSNNCVAVGQGAGQLNQSSNSVAVGRQAGNNTQGTNSVAVGLNAGKSIQGDNSVSIGLSAGQSGQGSESVAIGINSGLNSQGTKSIAIGTAAGSDAMGQESIAIGCLSCSNTGFAGDYSTSIGSQTKHEGTHGVSLGYKAGTASGSVNNAFYIGMDGYTNTGVLGNSCIRPETTTPEDASNSWRLIALNTSTGEIKYLTGLSNQALNPGTVEPLTMDITTGQIGHG